MTKQGYNTQTVALSALLLTVMLAAGSATAQDAPSAPNFRAHPFFKFDSDDGRTADIALADLDCDGDLDALVANGRHWAQQDFMFLNAGSGRFLEARRLGVGLAASYAHLVDDFNTDGHPDIVTLGDQIPAMLRLNDGAGQYGAALRLADTDGHVRSGTVLDANSDGQPDIAIATRLGADVILLSDGLGSFSAPIDLPGDGKGSTGLATGDFNGDGRTDLVVARRDGSASVVMMNRGNAKFEAVPLNGSVGDHRKAVVGDFNGDATPDILLVSTDGDHKLYTETDSDGFGAPLSINRDGHATQAMAAADLNDDGRLDLVEGNDGTNYILLNLGDGTFGPHPLSDDTEDTYGVSVADMNGDNRPDIIVANSGAANRVLIQR